ncbi:MAG: branched-chain amino acid ABC transporter permease [Chloroflexi bacterium]|nr:branched-chain amino acid ABC transporter permease [Chloroflexota bacterium]
MWLLIVVALVAYVVVFHWNDLANWWKLNNIVLRQALVSGFLIGGIYSLIATGLTLIFGVLGIINFAHGAMMTIGMYITFWAFQLFGVDPYVSVIITVPALFLIGAVIQKLTIQPVMAAPAHNQLLLTLGIAIFIENLLLVLFTGDTRAVQTDYAGARFFAVDTMISLPRVWAFLGGLIVAGILYLILTRTDLGKAIRAVAEEKEGAALMGIDTERISLITFGLGAACAGAAGSLIMPFFTATPTMGETFNIMAFVVVVLGGMGNIPGALLGGIIVGITESLGAVFLPGSSKQLGVFIVFILVLLFHPTGLLGRRSG